MTPPTTPRVPPTLQEITVIEATIARFGWRDASAERVREVLGMSWERFQHRWPGGLDDLFRDLYLERCTRCCQETTAALSAFSAACPGAAGHALAAVALEAATAVWTDIPWRIVALEYGARLLRHPELLAGFDDLAATATTDLSLAIAQSSSLGPDQADALVSDLAGRCAPFGVGPWRELRDMGQVTHSDPVRASLSFDTV